MNRTMISPAVDAGTQLGVVNGQREPLPGKPAANQGARGLSRILAATGNQVVPPPSGYNETMENVIPDATKPVSLN